MNIIQALQKILGSLSSYKSRYEQVRYIAKIYTIGGKHVRKAQDAD